MTAASDLLQRAAAVLREHAARAPEGPWVSLDNGDRLIALRDTEKGFVYLVDEPVAGPVADYFAMLHPPVALALAAAMEAVAKAVRFGSDMEARVGYGELIDCAREVLRETEGGAG